MMTKAKHHRSEKGQALAETALFAILAVILTMAFLSYIPVHRTRTAATAAAYACAQFLSQSPNPDRAAANARQIAEQTINSVWTGTAGAQYRITVSPPSAPGRQGMCAVDYKAPGLFRRLLGTEAPWSTEYFVSRSETWKARWNP